jgi:hypothetical protein
MNLKKIKKFTGNSRSAVNLLMQAREHDTPTLKSSSDYTTTTTATSIQPPWLSDRKVFNENSIANGTKEFESTEQGIM